MDRAVKRMHGTKDTLGCDPRALRVAQAVQHATGITQVILFGSRARGDYQADSDIDLLLVHPEDTDLRDTAYRSATRAVQEGYGEPVGTDIVLMAPHLFATLQFGLNDIAAYAAKEGVTAMGYPYHPPTGEMPPQDPATLEAMKRCTHAKLIFETLQVLVADDTSQRYTTREAYELAVGQAAQGALELSLKALLAAVGQQYGFHHELERHASQAQRAIPNFRPLQSPLSNLSKFAGAGIYGLPSLGYDVSTLFAQVAADLEYVFALIQQHVAFDPWQVCRSDYES